MGIAGFKLSEQARKALARLAFGHCFNNKVWHSNTSDTALVFNNKQVE